MPQSPMASPSVIYRWNTDGTRLSIKFSREYFFGTLSPEIFIAHATITNGQSVSDLPLEIQTEHVCR